MDEDPSDDDLSASTKRRRTGEGGGEAGSGKVGTNNTSHETTVVAYKTNMLCDAGSPGSFGGDTCDIQHPSMEEILGVPLEILFRKVGSRLRRTSAVTGSRYTVEEEDVEMEEENDAATHSCTGRHNDGGGGGGKPIMNRVEAEQFLKIMLLAQELDVLTSLAEEILSRRSQARHFRNVIRERYSQNPWVTPLLPILTTMEQGGSWGREASSSSPLHHIHTSLTQLTWDLQICAFHLQQSAEQNWSLVDSLLDVIPDGAHSLVLEKQALAELQEEVARRIYVLLQLQNEMPEQNQRQEEAQNQNDDDARKSRTQKRPRQQQGQSSCSFSADGDSIESSRRKLFIFPHQREEQDKQGAVDANGRQQGSRSRIDDSNLFPETYTPLADFCARVFSFGDKQSNIDEMETEQEEGTVHSTMQHPESSTNTLQTQQQPNWGDTIIPNNKELPGSTGAVINDASAAAPASPSLRLNASADGVATTSLNGYSMSQTTVAGTMMTMMLQSQTGSNRKTKSPQSAQQSRGDMEMATAMTKAQQKFRDSGTDDGCGRYLKENKCSIRYGHQQFSVGSQNPCKVFEYPDATTMVGEGQQEDSQMSFQHTTHAAEALAGLVHGKL